MAKKPEDPPEKDLFDLPEGKRLKENGMDDAANGWGMHGLALGRSIAEEFGMKGFQVSADDVSRELKARGHPQLGPEAGSLFKGSSWVFTGKRVLSQKVGNHARELKVWRYLG